MSSTKPPESWSLATRLTAWYTLASFTLTLLSTGFLYWALSKDLSRDDDLFLADKVHVLRAILHDRPDDVSGLREEVELETAARHYAQFYVRLLDDQGRVRMTTPGMDALVSAAAFRPPLAAAAEPDRGYGIQSPQGRAFWAIAARAAFGSSGRAWQIQVAVDQRYDQSLLAKYRSWLWGVLAIAGILCPLVGYRIARRGIRPVEQITETARRTGSSTLDARIDPAGYPVELAALAQTLNDMLDRLQDSFRRLSQFSADIAHELRTPINNIRGEAEVALSRARSFDEYREALTSCLEESVRLSELISSLLFLARVESPGTHLKREPVRVVPELTGVCEFYEAAAAEAGITLTVAPAADLEAPVDRSLLRQAVGNLVANALTHTPRGGAVTLAAHGAKGWMRIEVADTGAGIPAEDLPRIFDRFYRVDKARSSPGSMGLGLAIVKGIAVLHGGRAEIESEVGRGTRIALVLPMA